MKPASGRPGVAFAAVLVHLALALAVIGVAAPSLSILYRGWRGPVSFAAEMPSPAWIAPLLFAAIFVLVRIGSFVLGRRFPLAWTWAVIIVLAACVAGRALAPTGPAGFTSLQGAPPTVQTAEVLRRLQKKIDQGLASAGEVPSDSELASSFRVDGAELWPSYVYAHFARRPFRLVRVDDAAGPVDRKRPGDLAGTIYLAVAADHHRYWLTALVLLEDNGVRSSDLLPGPDGVLVLTNAGGR